MAEPQNQDQPIPGPITVTPGGTETAPISVVPEQGQNDEPRVEIAPGLKPPELSEDLQEAGVRYNTINPPVSQDAQNAGATPSIPIGPSFVPPAFQSAQEAENISKQTPVNRGLAWQATEWLKGLLQGKKQPSEA